MEKKYILAFFLPTLILIFFSIILPLLVVVNYSVQEPYAIQSVYLGLGKYDEVLDSGPFWEAFQRNLLYSAICLAIEIPLGLALALFIPRIGKIPTIVSAAVVLPCVLPYISIGILWRLLVREGGPIRTLLLNFFAYDPFTNTGHGLATIIALDVWHWTSIVFLIFFAGLAAMPEPLYLAAQVDGATRWQTFRRITLPGLRFPLAFIVLLRFIDSFKVFDEPYILTGGGPGRTTEFLSQFIVRKAMFEWAAGFAAAGSLIYLFIVMMITYLMVVLITRGRGLL